MDIESFLGFRGRDQFHTLLKKFIDGHDWIGGGRVAEAGEAIDKVAKVASGLEAIVIDAVWKFHIADAEVFVVGVSTDDKRCVFCA